MRERKRRMLPYHPRPGRKSKAPLMQKLHDLQRNIGKDVGDFLVLLEEGEKITAEKAKMRARSDLLKFGPEISTLAVNVGGRLPVMVKSYLQSVDQLIHTNVSFIDPQLIHRYFHVSTLLEKELREPRAA